MPYGFAQSVWADAKEEALAVLRGKAVQNNPLITYSEIAGAIRAIEFNPDDKGLHELLGEISVDENAAGRGMLSILVVHKHGAHKPGPGFLPSLGNSARRHLIQINSLSPNSRKLRVKMLRFPFQWNARS